MDDDPFEGDGATRGTSRIVVRPAEVDDAEQITKAHVKAWQVAYRGIMPDSYLDDLSTAMAARRDRWRVQIAAPADPTVSNLVAERCGSVIGWVSSAASRDPDAAGRPGGTGEIWGIYVHPGHWRTGVGSALMRASLRHLQAEGYTEATLWVFEGNAGARGFYERHGWRADGATHFFERGGAEVPEIRYRRPLP